MAATFEYQGMEDDSGSDNHISTPEAIQSPATPEKQQPQRRQLYMLDYDEYARERMRESNLQNIAYHGTSPVADARDGHHPSRRWVYWFPWLDSISREPGLGKLFVLVEYEEMIPHAISELLISRTKVFSVDVVSFELSEDQKNDYRRQHSDDVMKDEKRLGQDPHLWLSPTYLQQRKGHEGPCMRYLTIGNTEGLVVRFDMKMMRARLHDNMKEFLYESSHTLIVYNKPAAVIAWTNLLTGRNLSHRFPSSNVVDLQLYMARMASTEALDLPSVIHRYLDEMTTLQFSPKDEDILLAPDAATAMRQGGNTYETFLRTLEYCGARVQLHDVLLALHQRFDNVPSDIEDIDGYWPKLDMAVRSVHPKCRGIATKYPQQSIQPQAALRVDEGPIIRKVYDIWLAKTYVDMKTASCYYAHDVNDTLTPLLIAEKTDDEVTTIAWTVPPQVERRYNEWFKDDGCPRGRINATTNAPENEDFEVSIDIYGPSFCQREAMG